MAGILDTPLVYGAETTYGTASVTLTRGYEAKVDAWKKSVEYMETRGFRSGLQAMSAGRTIAVPTGGSGTLNVDVFNKSMGMLLRDMFVTTTGPTQQGATTAWLTTFATGAGGPTTSATIQQNRVGVTGTSFAFTHLGCLCTGWELSQEVGGKLELVSNFDFQDVSTVVGAGTPVYAATPTVFHWGNCVVSIGGSAVDMKSISLTANYNMATDRRFLKGSTLKSKPVTAQLPSFEGTIEGEFLDLTQYNRFVSGAEVVAQFKWTGALIEGAHNFEFTVDMPAIQIRGESPEVSLDDFPKQSIPFVVLWNGTNPAITVSTKSTDVAL
jgi:hypothetical protein